MGSSDQVLNRSLDLRFAMLTNQRLGSTPAQVIQPSRTLHAREFLKKSHKLASRSIVHDNEEVAYSDIISIKFQKLSSISLG